MTYAAARALKVAVYGAQSPLGQALINELLNREHEAVPLQADLKALPPRAPIPNRLLAICSAPIRLARGWRE